MWDVDVEMRLKGSKFGHPSRPEYDWKRSDEAGEDSEDDERLSSPSSCRLRGSFPCTFSLSASGGHCKLIQKQNRKKRR